MEERGNTHCHVKKRVWQGKGPLLSWTKWHDEGKITRRIKHTTASVFPCWIHVNSWKDSEHENMYIPVEIYLLFSCDPLWPLTRNRQPPPILQRDQQFKTTMTSTSTLLLFCDGTVSCPSRVLTHVMQLWTGGSASFISRNHWSDTPPRRSRASRIITSWSLRR